MSQVSLSDRVAFVKKFGPLDLEISKREGFLPGILTGWAAMESAWGVKTPKDGTTGRDSNNIFGIKAGPTWQKLGRPFVTSTTHEFQDTGKEITIKAAFRAYPDWRASAEDVVKLMKIEGVYHGALDALKRKDAFGFLKGIAASGYSTAKDYDQRILGALRAVADMKIA